MRQMKRLLLAITACCTALLTAHAQGTTFETAQQAVGNMQIGWNLGNTLDSHSADVTGVTETETLRGQPVTQPELMEMMKMAGFNAIRVPVTWYPHMNEEGTVDPAWMARVREVVDYVINEGMYCIIDVHHDTGKTDSNYPGKGWLRADMDNYNQNKARFEYLWQQIATEFRDYGERLIFEGYNELLDNYNSYNFASFKTENRYDATVAASAYNAVNSYARSFVEAVRATGGNNLQRNLIVNTYAGCTGYGSWSDYLQDPLKKMQKPEDSNHIIFGIHAYPAITDTSLPREYNDEIPIVNLRYSLGDMFDYINTHLVSQGAPVIIGELGTANVDASPNDYDAHREHLFRFVKETLTQSKSKNVAAFYWMGLSHKDFRSMPAFNQADLAETMLKAWYGDDYEPLLLTPDDYKKTYQANFNTIWGELQLAYNANRLNTEYSGIEVEFEDISQIAGGMLSFRMYSWTDNSSYINYQNITNTLHTINFSDVPLSSICRATIVWRTSGRACSVKIKRAQLIKQDGTKVDATLEIKTPERLTLNTIATPLYGKAKIKVEDKGTMYYGDRNLIVPEGATATTYKWANNELLPIKTYEAGTVIPAGTGVVVSGINNKTYKFEPTDQTGEPSEGNMLRGTDEDALTTGGEKYYRLALDGDGDPASIGFYYGAEAGAAFTNKAHEAYLALPATARYEQYPFDNTLGISDHIAEPNNSNDNRWYQIDGTLLNGKPTKKGIYIHKGRKVVM